MDYNKKFETFSYFVQYKKAILTRCSAVKQSNILYDTEKDS